MKIVLTGAQGTGKTTLAEELAKCGMFKDYEVPVSLARRLALQGYKINEEGNEETQKIIMQVQDALSLKENIISDRCAIDCAAYTMYHYCRGQLGNNGRQLSKKQLNQAIEICDRYDYIFFIRPEIPLVNDGQRSANPVFQVVMDMIFESIIAEVRIMFPKKIFRVTGTVDERVQQVLSIVLNAE